MSEAGFPPAAEEAIDEGLHLRLPGRRQPARAGWRWIVDGCKLFARAPLMWVISIVVLFLAAVLISLVPVVGSIAYQLLQAVFAGGFMFACRSLEKGGDFELEHLLSGFTRRFVPLLVVGALFVLGGIVIVLVFLGFTGMSLLAAFIAGDSEQALAAATASAGTMLLGALVALALLVPLMAAFWFAPALVMLHNLGPLDAMKESLFGCLRNVIPFLVYGLVMFVAALVAAIPMGLGFLVLMPVMIASSYAGYRGIFTVEEAMQPSAPASG